MPYKNTHKKKDSKIELLSFYALIFVFSGICLYCSFQAYHAFILNKEIEHHGQVTTGKISACGSSTNTTYITYTFQANPNNPQLYTNTNFGSTFPSSKCKKGDKITVYYLPENPNKSVHSKSQDLFINMVGLITSLLLVFYSIGIKLKIFRFPKK